MKNALAFIFLASFAVMLALTPIWLWLASKYFRMLESDHPELYLELGEPGLITNNNPSTMSSFIRYILGKRYHDNGDPILVKQSLVLKRCFLAYVSCFAIAVGVIVVGNT